MLDPRGGPDQWLQELEQRAYATYQATVMRPEPIRFLTLPASELTEELSVACWTPCVSTTKTIWPRDPTTAIWPHALPVTSWLTKCSPRLRKSFVHLAGNTGHSGIVRRNRSTQREIWKAIFAGSTNVDGGVRFVQIYSGGAHNDDNWDAHTDRSKPQSACWRNRQADCRTDQRSEGPWSAEGHADCLGRRIWPSANGRICNRQRARSQQLRLHNMDGRRRNQAARQSAQLTKSAAVPWTTCSTSNTCTPPFCSSWV